MIAGGNHTIIYRAVTKRTAPSTNCLRGHPRQVLFYQTAMKHTLNANQIKLIAIAAMTADHIAWLLFPGYSREALPILLHLIGRITCPVMCYFIAEGYHHTKDLGKYTRQLFLFALLSHFAYIFASGDFVDWRSFIPFYYGSLLNQTSVMWPLAWGLVMLRVAHSSRLSEALKPVLIVLICLVTFPSDWSCIASLCVLAFGTNRGTFKTQMLWMVFYVAIYSAVYFFALDILYGLMQMAVVLAIPLIGMYNGRRGNSKALNTVLKWSFYLYYPLHLCLLGLLRQLGI